MIEIINNKIVVIDDNANMTFIDDKKLETLIKSMELVIGDVIIDERYCAEESEDIYSYIVEKIYTMPDYPKWNDVPFKDKPKAKLIIAFNKFIHDKLNKRTK
jgi:hypothetical protein